MIRAIETRYKGCRFRSRLEARWAVFFDAMKIEWEYEREGYELDFEDWFNNRPTGVTISGRQRYLPDFWLPQVQMHAEVKPTWPTPDEICLAARLAESGGHDKPLFGILRAKNPVLILDGVPSPRMYWAIHNLEFNHGGWDVGIWEYDLTDAHHYWLNEGRFFVNEGAWISAEVDFKPPYHSKVDGDCHGINAARAARFEFGESG